MFRLLKQSIKNYDREDYIDLEQLYFNYTEEEKRLLNGILLEDIESLDTSYGELCVFYKIDDCIFMIVPNSTSETMDSDMFEETDSNISHLFILCNKSLLMVNSEADGSVLFNSLMIYDQPDYTGHHFEEVVDFFKPFSVYRIHPNSPLLERDTVDYYRIYSFYLLWRLQKSLSHYGSKQWEQKTLQTIENVILSGNNSIPFYLIASSLSSKRWSFIFLESYRLIEHTFAAIYLRDLYSEIGTSMSPLNLAAKIEDVLDWRPNELISITNIFKAVIGKEELKSFYNDLLIAKYNTDNASGFIATINYESGEYGYSATAKWYYKEIRNCIAHFRPIHSKPPFNDSQWNCIIRFNYRLIEYLYSEYDELL